MKSLYMQSPTIFALLTSLVIHVGFYSLIRPEDSLLSLGSLTFVGMLFLCYGFYWVLVEFACKVNLLQRAAWIIFVFFVLLSLHFVLGLSVFFLAQFLPDKVLNWLDMGQFELLYRRSYSLVFLSSVLSGHLIRCIFLILRRRKVIMMKP